MEQSIHDYLDEIDSLIDEAERNAEKILQAINMDELLKDPEGYLLALGDAFLNEHIDEVNLASKKGDRFAGKLLSMI